MTGLIGISGSGRRAWFNRSLLRAASALLPDRASMQLRTLPGSPLCDGSLEAAYGVPASAAGLKQALALKDAVVLQRVRVFLAGLVDAVHRSQR